MNLKPEEKKTLFKTALYGIAGLGLYYLYKGKSVTESAKKAVETPIDVVIVAAKHTKEFTKDVIKKPSKIVKIAKKHSKEFKKDAVDADVKVVKTKKKTKNKGVSKEEFKRRMAAGRAKAAAKKKDPNYMADGRSSKKKNIKP